MPVTGLHVENMAPLDGEYASFDIVWTDATPGVDHYHITQSLDGTWSDNMPAPANRYTFANVRYGPQRAFVYGTTVTITVQQVGAGSGTASVVVKVMTIPGVQGIMSQPHGLEASFAWDMMDNEINEEQRSLPWGSGTYYVFNDWAGMNSGGAHTLNTRPAFYVHEIGGIDDADVRDSREVRPSQHGEDAYDALYGGRTLTFTGELRAPNLRMLRLAWQQLRWAFLDLKEHYLVFQSGARMSETMIKCRKSAAMTGREVQEQNYWRRDILLTLRASEPWFVSRDEHESTTAPTQTFTLGRTYTRLFETRYTEYLDVDNDVIADPTGFAVWNDGNFQAYPRFVLTGPMEAPIIQNLNTGEAMYLYMTIPDGETVTVDTQSRTIVDSAGNNLFSVLAPISDWITLAPGDNGLAITVRTFVPGSNALATVTWRDTWM